MCELKGVFDAHAVLTGLRIHVFLVQEFPAPDGYRVMLRLILTAEKQKEFTKQLANRQR
jgi:hypothetical protein